jgi:hypothetical protein
MVCLRLANAKRKNPWTQEGRLAYDSDAIAVRFVVTRRRAFGN